MTMHCNLCGCSEDDAYETEAGSVSCLCGIDTEGFDPEDLQFGFHLVDVEAELDRDADDPFPEEG